MPVFIEIKITSWHLKLLDSNEGKAGARNLTQNCKAYLQKYHEGRRSDFHTQSLFHSVWE